MCFSVLVEAKKTAVLVKSVQSAVRAKSWLENGSRSELGWSNIKEKAKSTHTGHVTLFF